MKTLIIYGTKYGCTEKCASMIHQEIDGEVDVKNFNQLKRLDLDIYDRVIIGGSIYMGNIQKQIKQFCQVNQKILLTKKLGLFICCLSDQEDALNRLANAYGEELLNHATAKDFFGGEIVYQKLNFLHRLIMNMVAKSKDVKFPKPDVNKNICTLNVQKIKQFCLKLKA